MCADSSEQSLRKRIRVHREALPPVKQQQNARKAAGLYFSHPLLRRATRVGIYRAHRGEANPAPIANRLWREGKQCFLPCLLPGARFEFRPYWPHSKLRTNRFGIGEPATGNGISTAARLDLVLLPLVAFDRSGSRLGMGAGYYDRHLAFRQQHNPPPLLVGLAYAFQEVRLLRRQPWDVPLDFIITETRMLDCRPYSRNRR